MKSIFNRVAILFAILIILFAINALGQENPEMEKKHKLLIHEAIKINNLFGEEVWEGISKVPFTVLLITEEFEFLINHENPSDDFNLSEHDSLLESHIYYRPRQFEIQFLAMFPAVNGVNCIVVGTPENTSKSNTEWIITLLHEHFHQYQNSWDDYYTSVNNLELSNGDNTGMWMLNYPFPYKDKNVKAAFDNFIEATSNCVKAIENASFNDHYKVYLAKRNDLKKILNPNDYKYLSFQVWQEGIARYTEYKFTEFLEDFTPSKELVKFDETIRFKQYAGLLFTSEMKLLVSNSLKKNQRICFYSVGFAEGLILDKVNPDWKKNYMTNKFFIEKYY